MALLNVCYIFPEKSDCCAQSFGQKDAHLYSIMEVFADMLADETGASGN
jgi:hypothetical protein